MKKLLLIIFSFYIFFSIANAAEKKDCKDFKTLFIKGDLKELELDHFSKRDNSKRREAAKKIQREVQLHQRKKRNPIYLFVSAFKFVVGSLIEIPKWILFKTFAVVLKLELWSKTR